MNITSQLPTWHLEDKRVLLRADLNIPLVDQTIANDFRLQALLPTLNFLIKHHANVILATHIGQPKDHDPNLSTKILIPWFEQHGYDMVFAENFEHAANIEFKAQQIVLLENLRFFPGEKKRNSAFAKQLASLADYYINDAFGTMHRDDASITLVPQEFRPERRTIGFLVEQELNMLNQLIENPEQPFVVILGGGKVADKIPLIQGMLRKTKTILL